MNLKFSQRDKSIHSNIANNKSSAMHDVKHVNIGGAVGFDSIQVMNVCKCEGTFHPPMKVANLTFISYNT